MRCRPAPHANAARLRVDEAFPLGSTSGRPSHRPFGALEAIGPVILSVLLPGCLSAPPYACERNEQCGVSGRCEPSGWCSHADEACESGRRFDGSAGGLAERCVDPSTSTGAGGSTGATDTGTGGASGTASGGTDTGDTGTGDTGTGDTGTAVCQPIPAAGRTIDETDPCFERKGPTEWWRFENAGYGGSLLWTYTLDDPDPTNSGTWFLIFEEPGRYQLEVYIHPDHGSSTQADYTISSADGISSMVIDQAASSQWTSLGEFEFKYLGGQWVSLGDNTGEPNANGIQLVFDAIRITRLDMMTTEETGR